MPTLHVPSVLLVLCLTLQAQQPGARGADPEPGELSKARAEALAELRTAIEGKDDDARVATLLDAFAKGHGAVTQSWAKIHDLAVDGINEKLGKAGGHYNSGWIREAVQETQATAEYATFRKNHAVRLAALSLLGETASEKAAAGLSKAGGLVRSGLPSIGKDLAKATETHDRAAKALEKAAQKTASLYDGEYRTETSLRMWQARLSMDEIVCDVALDALSTLGEKALGWLAREGVKQADPFERCAALAALGKSGLPAAVDPVLEALRMDKDPYVRVAAIDALVALRAERAVPEIQKCLSAGEWEVLVSASAALGVLKHESSVEPLIELLAKVEADGGRLPNDVSLALEALTGEGLGRTAGPWRLWWADHKEGWKPPREAKAPKKPDEDAGGTVAFYGLKVVSKRIAFVLDISGSMKEPAKTKGGTISSGGSADTPAGVPPLPQNPTKLDIAKHELIKSLRGLRKDVYFAMVFYSDSVQVWQEELVPATPENIEKAIAAVKKLEPSGATNIFDATEKAFELTGPDPKRKGKSGADTIYLLSDGAPNRGKFVAPDDICREVLKLNRVRKVIVHTIAVGDADVGFMERLATQNGGKSAHFE